MEIFIITMWIVCEWTWKVIRWELMINGGGKKFKTSTCIDLYFHANKKSIGRNN